MATVEQPSSANFNQLPYLSIEHNAESWFRLDPDIPGDVEEQQIHLAALHDREPNHPDIAAITERLLVGDALYARTLAQMTLSQAYGDFNSAVDKMTGLKTQAEYDRWLTSTFGVVQRVPKERTFTCYWGDVNNFKRINDMLGQRTGDEVMRAVGREINSNLRVGDHIIAVRPHTAGDEVIIAAADLTEEGAKGLWKRLYTVQLEKISRQPQIWQAITDALQVLPEEPHISARTEVIHVQGEDIVVTRRLLVINGRTICEMSDLAIIDLGYNIGLPLTMDDITVISEKAEQEKTRIKQATRTQIKAYR